MKIKRWIPHSTRKISRFAFLPVTINMEKLKPCPFCGSNSVAFEQDEDQRLDNTTTGFIWCHGCDFTSDSFYSEKIAAEKWNRRPDHGTDCARGSSKAVVEPGKP